MHGIQAHWELDLGSHTLLLCLLCLLPLLLLLLLLLRLPHEQRMDAPLQLAALLSKHSGRCSQEAAV